MKHAMGTLGPGKTMLTSLPVAFSQRLSLAVLFCLTMSLQVLGSEKDAILALEKGVSHYEEGAFEKAIEAFDEAGRLAEKSGLSRSTADFNKANSLSRLGNHEEATDAYMQALRSTDLTLQQSAYFNIGNTLVEIAKRDLGKGEVDAFRYSIKEALEMFRHAMTLDPDDVDAKVNYEIAQAMMRSLESAIADLFAFKESVQRLVRKLQFRRIIPYLNEELPKHEWALQLHPDEKTFFTTVWQNTEKVIGVQEMEPPVMLNTNQVETIESENGTTMTL